MDDSAPGQAAATTDFPGEDFPTVEFPAVADLAAGGTHGADVDWVVLASPAAAARPGRAPSPARAAGLVTLAAVVVAAVVALGGLLVSQRIAEEQAVHDVAELTDDLAVSMVQPALTDAMATDPAQARVALDPLVRHWLGGVGEMVRVKVWTTRGTVLYSDEPRLTGQTFPLDDDLRAVFFRGRAPRPTSPTCPARRTATSAARASFSRSIARSGRPTARRFCSRRTSATTSSASAAGSCGAASPA
jgi:hypothetical protein